MTGILNWLERNDFVLSHFLVRWFCDVCEVLLLLAFTRR